jgi:D-cysteine desulfhydrase family pyridoxal phosphate-dependent enzyme
MRPIPRLRFANLPTPVQEMPRLSAHLGGPHLLVKRDDLTGLAFGGNKTRKLELLVAEAQANGARTLVTAGAVQSNHCRQTAAAAAAFGFDCILVLAGRKPTRPSGNVLLDLLFGAELVWGRMAERDQLLKDTFQNAWDAGRRPYLVPYGGSSPTGAFAYALAVQELLTQCRDGHLERCRPDWIVFPSSSGGTQAGLALGKRLFEFTGKVLGISVDEEAAVLKSRVARLATATADFVGERLEFAPDDILVDGGYLGGGYGVLGAGEREAVQMFARLEGLLLDPVYTGRAAAGMIDLIRKGYFKKGETVLFWHTGGTPALFAEKYADIID